MDRLDGGAALPLRWHGGIVALGNFDGFHAGHQAVVAHALDLARAAGKPGIVATFDPHPVRYFKPDAAPFALTTIDQRERLFAQAGADAMIVFPFNASLAALSAEEFVCDRLGGIGGVVTGEDFTFGRGRSGDVDALRMLGSQYGFVADSVSTVLLSGELVSSSRIRAALEAGDVSTATRLLTRPFAMEGKVQHGDKVGRTIGFPTANIAIGNYLRSRYGIYAVRVKLADGQVFGGAANLGIRPSFDPPKELLEAYLFDFEGDLYDQLIEVELHAFIRPEAKFETMAALMSQMALDCDAARAILRR